MDSLIDLKHALVDAEEAIDHAARLAYRLSGEDVGQSADQCPYRETCPECNGTGRHTEFSADGWRDADIGACPGCGGTGGYDATYDVPEIAPVEGWPLLVALSDRLERLIVAFRDAVGDEVRAAIAEAEREAMEDDREVIREP